MVRVSVGAKYFAKGGCVLPAVCLIVTIWRHQRPWQREVCSPLSAVRVFAFHCRQTPTTSSPATAAKQGRIRQLKRRHSTCVCVAYLCTQSFVNARQTCEYRFEQRIVRRRGYFLPLPSAASPYLFPSSNDLARLTPLVRGPLQENWSVHEILIYSHSKQPAASTPIRHIANQQQTRLLRLGPYQPPVSVYPGMIAIAVNNTGRANVVKQEF